MSYSLKIKDGDIVPSNGKLKTIEGLEKLIQDLRLWLLEALGTDRFHPKFGSSLDDEIGTIDPKIASVNVKAEILRVLQNYQVAQSNKIQKEKWIYQNSIMKQGYWIMSKEEVLSSINGIQISTQGSIMNVQVSLTTYSGVEAILPLTIDFYSLS